MQPRIYVYKITFQEVPLYYIGVHKERNFNEEYLGSPITHKEKWQIYTPQKEILREFDYTDDGWLEALDYETDLIRQVYNTDNNCLNEACGGRISLAVCREAARKANANMTPEQRSAAVRKGRANMSPEQRSAAAKKGKANMTPEQRSALSKKGKANMTPEQRSAAARKANASRTPEQRSAIAKKANASKTPEQRSEIARKRAACKTPEQRSEISRKGWANKTPEQRSAATRKASTTKFQCTASGYISTAGPLAIYQRARGIDTSNRVKVIPSLAAS
jgi:hypothetical protein